LKLDREHAWRTILSWYEVPGAAQALLREQEERGLDVVLHLFLRYARTELGLALGREDEEQAKRLMSPWRDQVISRVRALRRELKTMPGLEAIDDSRHDWREQLKVMEVKAERVQFMSLCAWLEGRAAMVAAAPRVRLDAERLGEGGSQRGSRRVGDEGQR